MPIYEYYCPDNHRIYQFFAKSIAQGQTTPTCPDNPAYRMVKMVSGFAIGGGKKSETAAASADSGAGGMGDASGAGEAGGADDARMEAAFAEMERDLGSIDENDPRAMGRMMRRMSELSGEKLDGEMEEMVRKLEEGQDPEKLEEELGGEGGDPGGMDDDDPGFGGGGGRTRGLPSRDPHLYDY